MTDIHNQQRITPFIKSPHIGSTGVDVVAGGGGGSGTPGSKWLSGATAPLQTLGAVGDWYVNYTNGNTYEKTATLTWTLRLNIVGAQGPAGATGATGAPGPTGTQGPQGNAGQGVPTGGTTGQVLAKINGDNYNTQWVTPSSGGGTVSGNYVPTDQFPVTFGVQLTGNTAATASTTVPVATVRAPFAFTLTEVRAWASASDGTVILIDIESTIGGTAQSLLGNRIMIDANELTSLDATTQPTIVNANIASDQELRFFVDQVGAGARNLMVWLLGRRVITLTPMAPNAPAWTLGSFTLGANTATVYWAVPGDNGSPITSYSVEYKRAIDSTWTAYTGTIGSTTIGGISYRSAAIVGLTAGTLHDVRVRATNAVESSAWSATQFTTTGAPTVPGAPTALSGTPTATSVALSWTAPASNGGSVISDYVVEYKLSSVDTWSRFNDGNSNATTATVTGLSSSTSYNFRVSAVNIAGTGAASTTYTVSTSAPTGGVPNAPTALLVDGGASGGGFYNSAGTLSWTAPVGGGTVVDYIVEAKLNSEAATQWRRYVTRPTATSFGLFFGVSDPAFFYGGTTNSTFGNGGGTLYNFRVAASNANGQSAWVSGTWANNDSGG